MFDLVLPYCRPAERDGSVWERAKNPKGWRACTESPNEGFSDTSSSCLAQRPGQELPFYAISEQSGPLSEEQRLVGSGLD